MPLTLVQNLALGDTATSERTSTICEPTAAANDRQLMVTGNWFASTSTDGGANWTFLDPLPGSRGRPAGSAVTRSSSTIQATVSGFGSCSTSKQAPAATSSALRCVVKPSSEAGTTGTSPQRT